jgi:hypothetical protein
VLVCVVETEGGARCSNNSAWACCDAIIKSRSPGCKTVSGRARKTVLPRSIAATFESTIEPVSVRD